MARMGPDTIAGLDRVTPGELKGFQFLQEAARPHRDCVCWYRPLLGGAGVEPDFVLFGQPLGLLVLEGLVNPSGGENEFIRKMAACLEC